MSLTIHCKYKYFDSTVQRAEDRRQKFYFCRLPFAVNVKLNLSIDKSVLLGTKPLVDSIRHFIRDPSGVFSVCHLGECRIVH